MAGSTTGGIKSDRMLLMFKTIGQQIKNSVHPSSINQVHVGNHIIGSNEIYPHFVYFGLYFITIAASIVLTVLSGMDIQNAFASSISSLSNVGPALEAQGTLGNYNAVPVMAKVVFIIDMFMGRVEIYPILAVVMMAFTGKKR